MPLPSPLKKLEIWMTDETDLPYRYAHVRREEKRIPPSVAQRALELLASSDSVAQDTVLQVDFVGGEPSREFETLNLLQEVREHINKRTGTTINFRLISSGMLDDTKKKILKEKNITLRDRLSPMEPTDTWWHDVQQEEDEPADAVKVSIPQVKKSFTSFHQRLIVSRYSYEMKSRIQNLLSKGAESIFLVPRIMQECDKHDTPNLKESMREFADWFKNHIIDGELPPVLNARQLLYMVHRFNENNPVPIKNHCCDTHERVLLDVDGTMRTCRHFHVYPKWTVGTLEKGFYDPRRMNLHHYGGIMRGGCKTCNARFYCAGPCISAASVYADKYTFPLGYFCLFTKQLTEMMDYVYNTLKFEHPEKLAQALAQIEPTQNV